MIQKEAWYKETEKKELPNIQRVLMEMWSEMQTRKPRPGLTRLDGQSFEVSLRGYSLKLEALTEDTFKLLGLGGKFEENPKLQKEYEFTPGKTLPMEDIFRFILDNTTEMTWGDQVSSKQADSKYLLQDKRSKSGPTRSKLKVKSFQPHFGVGPTCYGIIDSSCESWLKDHEYKTEAEAKKALEKCKKGKTPLEFRGF